MKKTLICLCCMFCTILVHAYELGDYVEKDGVPSIVVYVDRSGEHGLLMSMSPYVVSETSKGVDTEKWKSKKRKELYSMFQKRYKFYYAARAKQQGAEALAHVDSMYDIQKTMIEKWLNFTPIVLTKFYQKTTPRELKKFYANLQGALSESGKDNTKTVINFCADNNYSLEDYCPEFYWATQLGENWFIPGNEELELLAQSCGVENIGRENFVRFSRGKTGEDFVSNFDQTNKEVAYLLRNVSIGFDYYGYNTWGGDVFWPVCSVQSSTMVDSDWTRDNASKAARYQYLDQASIGSTASGRDVKADDNIFYSLKKIYSWMEYKLTTETYYYTAFMKNLGGKTCAMSWF